MKFVVSEPKTRKAYSMNSDKITFAGKKIGEVIKLDEVGLPGYEGKITGGSDKQGFPMNKSVQGAMRKKIFTGNGVGFNAERKGERKRVSVRGNTVSEETAQVNLVVTKVGSVELDKILAKGAPKEEDTLTAKERAVKTSLEMAGSAELGAAPKKTGRH
ncbi:MAG: 30S ribosomal protein S6e [Candidatus Diapherotrites archaeon]|nr:30S ribosomal protein S6e [Candidatus Diapherotrites archaeon]